MDGRTLEKIVPYSVGRANHRNRIVVVGRSSSRQGKARQGQGKHISEIVPNCWGRFRPNKWSAATYIYGSKGRRKGGGKRKGR